MVQRVKPWTRWGQQFPLSATMSGAGVVTEEEVVIASWNLPTTLTVWHDGVIGLRQYVQGDPGSEWAISVSGLPTGVTYNSGTESLQGASSGEASSTATFTLTRAGFDPVVTTRTVAFSEVGGPAVVISDIDGNTSGVVEVMGPGVVHFSMHESLPGDGDLRHCRIDWDFGDPSGRYNNLRGFNVAHFYDVEPGSPQEFTVTCTITNRLLQSASATRTVRVLPNTRTVVTVGVNGADYTTPGAAWNGTAGGNIEFRFAAGETFTWDTNYGNSDRPNIIVRSTVKGEKFNVVPTGVAILSGSFRSGVRDIHFVEGPSDPMTRILDSIDEGWAVDITSDDNYVCPGFLRESRKGMFALNVQTTDFVSSAFKSSITPDGQYMVVLGCDVIHKGTGPGERPMRGFGQKWLVHDTRLETDVKNALAVQGDRLPNTLVYVSQSVLTHNGDGHVVALGHSSSTADLFVSDVVLERSLLVGSELILSLGQNRQGVKRAVVRNCILTNGAVIVGQSTLLEPEWDTENVDMFNCTVIYENAEQSANRHLRLSSSHYDNVRFDGILGVGWTADTSRETFTISNPNAGHWEFKNSVMPVATNNDDARVSGGTRISYAQLEAAYPNRASGLATKNITLESNYAPTNLSDPDLMRERNPNMAAFAEDYYGNPRAGNNWVVGAVTETT